MSAPACTRARSPLSLRARPAVRRAGMALAGRAPRRASERPAARERARRQPGCAAD